ncbi:fragile X mental retardation [Perkinsus olseni]|uniref:Fragile X mental retardation n=1 Tax=Perkinsus olseni TaxID=32597 RepID=A0A7J6PGT7_PEROL|nr:fragile X mental retardation [Perkinsus olseni]
MAECSTPSTLSGLDRDSVHRYSPLVEIRDETAPQKWFEGYLADVDVAKKMITVAFQDDVWGPKTVPMSQARLVPSLTSKALSSAYEYMPREGDTVEVRSPATGHAPVSWWSGPTSLSDLSSETVKVPKVLGDWIMSDDGQGCLNQVAIKSGLLKITPRADQKTGPSVTLIGSQRDIHRAKLLLDVHVKHQKEIQGFHEKRQAMLDESASFNIDSDLVGVMIGKNGAHINRVIKDYGVEVNVADKGTARDPKSRRVVIYGPSVDAVNKARAELEYLTERYPIPQDCIGWVIGRRFATLHEIADSANLNYARLDESTGSPCLVLSGRRQDLDDAKLLLDSHLQYHDVFEDMAKESRELGDEFYRLGDGPGPRRGKGKGKGKGGGGGGKGRSRGSGSSDSVNSAGAGRPNRPARRKGSGAQRSSGSDGKNIDEVGYRKGSESESIGIKRGRVLFDSGAGVIIGPVEEVTSLLNYIGKFVEFRGGDILKLIACSDVDKLPEIWFDVMADDAEGLTTRLFVSGQDYAVAADKPGLCTIDIAGADLVHIVHYEWILGSPLFRGYFLQFTYDVESIGFAKKRSF